jgi:hypothetical protein
MVATGLDIVSAVASIIQLVQVTCEICRRVNEFQSSTREIPKSFRQFSQELPLLQETLQKIKEAVENGHIPDKTQQALAPTIEGCQERVESLNNILQKTLPRADASSGEKAWKAIISLTKDSKSEKDLIAIRNYLSTLTFYFSASSSLLLPLTGIYLPL